MNKFANGRIEMNLMSDLIQSAFKIHMRLLAFLVCIFLISKSFHAQELKIIQTDTSQFPLIKLLISFKGNQKLSKEEIKLLQDNKPLDFTLEAANPNAKSNSGRAIYVIVESSGNTYGKAITDIKTGVISALDNLKKTDIVNVGYFGSKQVDSIGLRAVNTRFISEKEILKQKVGSNIIPYKDSLRRCDLYGSVLDALLYLENEPELPLQKMLIVVSTSRNESKMNVSASECIAKARELKIPIYSINYADSIFGFNSERMNRISKQTNGKYTNASNSLEIANALTEFINDPAVPTIFDGMYDLLFSLRINSGMTKAKVELEYANTRQFITISAPNNGLSLPEDYKFYLILSVGILLFILLIMLLVNWLSKRKPKAIEEQPETLTAPENEKDANQILDNKIKAAPGTPMLLSNFNGRTETFILGGDEVSIGRHESNDIRLNIPTVTGKHAIILIDNHVLTLIDLGSTNGTYVNGEKIKKRVLKSGDKIKLGDAELVLKA